MSKPHWWPKGTVREARRLKRLAKQAETERRFWDASELYSDASTAYMDCAIKCIGFVGVLQMVALVARIIGAVT